MVEPGGDGPDSLTVRLVEHEGFLAAETDDPGSALSAEDVREALEQTRR